MKFFITGISTDVGKTVASAIITEALEADYWKPIQAGDLDRSDSISVSRLISNSNSTIFPEAFKLNTPASPHLAAEIDGIEIRIDQIVEPNTDRHLVIEGAGGLLVPINASQTIADLIKPDYNIILISRNYLGSINHTLLTVEALRARNLTVAGIIFNGDPNPSTEEIIISKTGIDLIGNISNEPFFDKNVIREYAGLFSENLLKLTSS